MKHLITSSLVLALLWLGLSGHYTPLILLMAVVSIILVLFISHRMDVIDHESHPLHIGWPFIVYWFWLGKEIILANLAVARIICHPALPISPTIRHVPCSQKTDLGRVIFANSITLTPATVALDVETDQIKIHALTKASANELAKGEMDRRVSSLENT